MKTSIFCLLATFLSLSSIAQTTITGTISNTFEEKLHNSHISIKGTDIGTVSENGSFSILATKKDTLVVSHLGYMVKEIPVYISKMDIALEVESLDEVLIQAPPHRYAKSVCTVTTICYQCGVQVISTRFIEPKTFKSNVAALYPNPSSNGHFNIKLPDTFGELKLQVHSLQGQLLQSSEYQQLQGAIQVDLSSYATGMYLINVQAEGESLPTMRALKG